MGAIAGALALLARFALLISLPEAWRIPAILTAPMIGRMTIPLVGRAFPMVGVGLGAGWARTVGPAQIATALGIGFGGAALAGAVVAGGALRGLLAAVIALVACLALGRRWSRVLGGLTGDIYGALTEIGEIIALAVWAAGSGAR
jgi:adenosylcobinamide-GDP ribazoletransferase